jgi:hypothetical protein
LPPRNSYLIPARAAACQQELQLKLQSAADEKGLVQSKFHELSLQHRQLLEESPQIAGIWDEVLASQEGAGGTRDATAVGRAREFDLRHTGSRDALGCAAAAAPVAAPAAGAAAGAAERRLLQLQLERDQEEAALSDVQQRVASARSAWAERAAAGGGWAPSAAPAAGGAAPASSRAGPRAPGAGERPPSDGSGSGSGGVASDCGSSGGDAAPGAAPSRTNHSQRPPLGAPAAAAAAQDAAAGSRSGGGAASASAPAAGRQQGEESTGERAAALMAAVDLRGLSPESQVRGVGGRQAGAACACGAARRPAGQPRGLLSPPVGAGSAPGPWSPRAP